jgi:hypothetical protein
MVTASAAYLDLVSCSPLELRAAMLGGALPGLDELAGREFRGTNVPATSRLLGIRRFIKGFERRVDGSVLGYNRRVRGGNLATPWTPATWRGKDRFGFFTVTPVDPEARDNAYLNALLLDYGRGGNPRRDPTRMLRDYLVRVDAGLFVGAAYAAVGRARVPLGYFVLEPVEV